MDGARSDPPDREETGQAAGGGPEGVRWFERHAPALLEQGYEPLPIRPGKKAPAPSPWSEVAIEERVLEQWRRRYGDHGIGLRTGRLVGLDIDILDPDRGHEVMALAQRRLGATLMRVGRWPKRLLLYRAEAPFRKLDPKPLEVLGAGQQFVGFGIHEDTGKPYSWPLGETPLDVPRRDLPEADHRHTEAVVAEARAIVPEMAASSASGRRGSSGGGDSGVVRDEHGLVVDGRDGWVSRIAYHVVHDAIDRGDELDPERLGVWSRDLVDRVDDESIGL